MEQESKYRKGKRTYADGRVTEEKWINGVKQNQ
jgi:hypothetical protein